jgi:DNA-binding MarR family transcriptional regulator
MELKISELAERLDITPPFASVLANTLQQRRLVTRSRSSADRRVMRVTVTTTGRALLHAIDDRVKGHIDYFSSRPTGGQKERAVAILLFYVGLTVAGNAAPRSSDLRSKRGTSS